MKFKKKELAKKLGCSLTTLLIYICRPEFAHVRPFKDNNGFSYFDFITEQDLINLKKIIFNGMLRAGRLKNIDICGNINKEVE